MCLDCERWHSQAALAKQLADKVVEVEALAVALDAAEAAAGASGEAEVAAETAAAQLAGVTVEVAVELQHIESEITRLAGRQQQAADGGGGRRAGRSNKRCARLINWGMRGRQIAGTVKEITLGTPS